MKYLIAITLSILALTTSCDQPSPSTQTAPDTTRYEVVFRESLAGSYKKWSTGDDSFGYYYAYTDRGRGPELNEQVTLNDQNFITQQSITGVNYLKDAVDESFTSNATTASWANDGGKDEGAFSGDELYFRYDGSPAAYEILGRLLLSSTDKKMSLYPEGELELVDVIPMTLSGNTSASLVMLKGLDMNPSYLWMDEGNMMGLIQGNRHIVREDLSPLRKEMKALQDSIENEYLFAAAKQLTNPISTAVILDVDVFTKDGTLLKAQDVFVNGSTIEAIYPAGQRGVPSGTMTLVGTGKTLMPGMFDMHTHNTKFRGALHLAGGITSVRDLANNKQVMGLADQFNNNKIMGPRIVKFCGIIDGSGPFANTRNVVNTLEEGLAEIEDYKRFGYDQIKLYSSIRTDWVGPMVTKAHDLGMRVSGHIPAYMTASQAINLGYDEIQHMNMLFLNFMSDTIDTRTPLRFTMVANHGAALDLTSDEYLDFVALLKAEDILVDPTVSIFENMFTAEKGVPSPTYEKIIKRLPLINQRGYYSGGLPTPEGQDNLFAEAHLRMLEVVYDLYKRGVDIVPGTDGLPGFLYHRELELYEKAGIPATEVLRLATIISAELAGVADSHGSVEVGKAADLILVDGDPTADISDIRKIEWTMKGGNLYLADELYGSMGIKHFK
ncbi:MAG: amidohydrolase family protein [Cyclobacteriaceae bacterium]